MIFRRKKDAVPDDVEATDDVILEDDTEEPDTAGAASEDAAAEPEPDAEIDRSAGPFDLTEVDEPDAMAAQRIDLGALQIPLFEGLEIRVEIDEQAGQPIAVTLIRGEGAVQVRVFSAPRSGGTWADARREITQSITGDGGTIDLAEGPFGHEVRAMVPAQDEQGNQVIQPIRFIGVEGPRWMLQGILLGAGSQPELAGELEEVYRGVVVVRGDTAMPPGIPLTLTIPQQVPGEVSEIEELDEE